MHRNYGEVASARAAAREQAQDAPSAMDAASTDAKLYGLTNVVAGAHRMLLTEKRTPPASMQPIPAVVAAAAGLRAPATKADFAAAATAAAGQIVKQSTTPTADSASGSVSPRKRQPSSRGEDEEPSPCSPRLKPSAGRPQGQALPEGAS